MEQFMTASRLKLRFETSAGLMTCEDLWDLPLQKGKVNLDDLAVNLSRKLQEGTESFVNKTEKTNTLVQLKFDIVKYIIEARVAEQEAAISAAVRVNKKKQILDIIERKENKDLEEKSLDDLKGLLANL